MNAPIKLSAYGVAIALTFGAGIGVGAAVGPLRDAIPETSHQPETSRQTDRTMHSEEGNDMPTGLNAGDAGYTFTPEDTTFTPQLPAAFIFRVLGPDGAPVTAFDSRHERDLHLVVVSNDLGDYQHLHPSLAADGTWSVTLTLPRSGGYRAYADFAPTGAEPLTLAVGLTALGEVAPQPLPDPDQEATVDGYAVHLDGGLVAGARGDLRFRVDRDGATVDDLEPYLGAFGHLVAIRATDQAYLHVHAGEMSSPREVAFAVHAPTPGAYRLFLDFQHEGVVHTAAFTIDIPTGDSLAGDGNTSAHDEGTGHGSH